MNHRYLDTHYFCTPLTFDIHVNVVPPNARCAPDARVRHDHCHGLVVYVADDVMPDLHKMVEVIQRNIVLQERTEVRNRLIDNYPASQREVVIELYSYTCSYPASPISSTYFTNQQSQHRPLSCFLNKL